MMNSNNRRYVVNIWQGVPRENFAVLTVDLCPENDDGVDHQLFKNNQLFKKVLKQFKTRSTAEWFTVIVICTIEQQESIFDTMNKELNLPSERCFWIDCNPYRTMEDSNKGHKSVVRGLVMGYHHSTASEPGAAVKASWQEAVGSNAFHCPPVKADKFILDANQEPVSSISMIKFNRISLL
jgi:hypothetical protein